MEMGVVPAIWAIKLITNKNKRQIKILQLAQNLLKVYYLKLFAGIDMITVILILADAGKIKTKHPNQLVFHEVWLDRCRGEYY